MLSHLSHIKSSRQEKSYSPITEKQTLELLKPPKLAEAINSIFSISSSNDGKLTDLISNYHSQTHRPGRSTSPSPEPKIPQLQRFTQNSNIIVNFRRNKIINVRKSGKGYLAKSRKGVSYDGIYPEYTPDMTTEKQTVKERVDAFKSYNYFSIYPTPETCTEPFSPVVAHSNTIGSLTNVDYTHMGYRLPNHMSRNQEIDQLPEPIARGQTDWSTKISNFKQMQDSRNIQKIEGGTYSVNKAPKKSSSYRPSVNYSKKLHKWGNKLKSQAKDLDNLKAEDQASGRRLKGLVNDSKLNIKDDHQMNKIQAEIDADHREIATRKMTKYYAQSVVFGKIMKTINEKEKEEQRKNTNRWFEKKHKIHNKFGEEEEEEVLGGLEFKIRPHGGTIHSFTELKDEDGFLPKIKSVKFDEVKIEKKAKRVKILKTERGSNNLSPSVIEARSLVDKKMNVYEKKLCYLESTQSKQLRDIKTDNQKLEYIMNEMHKKENINNALLKALKSGDLDKVERIVISNQNLVNKLFYMNQTCLHIAVKKGHMKMVKFLVEHGASPTKLDLLNRDCFQIASQYNNIGIMTYFQRKFGHFFPELDK